MNSKTLGYIYVLLAITIFAGQDAFSKLLGDKYPPMMVTMIRFWAFAVFVTLLAASAPGGLRRSVVTKRPVLQVIRGMLLVSEVVVVVISFTIAGLAMTQSIFQATPLMITLLSVPLLGETVGWRRCVALAVGLVGVLIILNPTNVHFDIRLLLRLVEIVLEAHARFGVRCCDELRREVAVRRDDYEGCAVVRFGAGRDVGVLFISSLDLLVDVGAANIRRSPSWDRA